MLILCCCRLVYFIDDMNMPFVDKYDTQSAIELARQLVDYRGWYDKVKILLKEVMNCQYVACMNPTAGSFNITPRMQRHFVTFAVQMPTADIVRSIYFAIMDGHLSNGGFDSDVARLSGKLVDATIELHRLVGCAGAATLPCVHMCCMLAWASACWPFSGAPHLHHL
jgi:dynein heavy chain